MGKKVMLTLTVVIVALCIVFGLCNCVWLREQQCETTENNQPRYFVKIYNTETNEIYVQCSGDVEFEETETYYIVYDYFDKTDKGTYRYYYIRKTDKTKYVYQKLP